MEVRFKDYIKEQIEHRYAQPNVKNNGLESTFVPHDFASGRRNSRYCISPNLDSIRNSSKRIGFIDLCSMASIDMRRVNSNIKKIKKLDDLELISVGYGGFSINVIHFMYLLGLEVGEIKWIKKLTIYENDNISLTNAFRIYKDMTSIKATLNYTAHKFNLIEDDANIAKKIYTKDYYLNEIEITSETKVNKSDSFSAPSRKFFFGAPDFNTRKLLEDQAFIFTGHSGNEVDFWSRPIVDSDLTRETYGKIDLDYFFLNLVKSAEKMIEIFANFEPSELKKDTRLWRYNSQEETGI